MTLGPDLASVDQNGNPDWKIAETDGRMSFAIVRATYGTAPDTMFPTYRRQLDALGVRNTPYGVLRFGVADPVSQAQALLSVIGVCNQRYLPPGIDIEGSRNGLTAAEALKWVRSYWTEIKKGLGVAPLFYTSRMYWEDPAGLDGQPAPDLAESLGWWKYWPYPVRSQAVYNATTVDRLPAPPCPSPWGNQWGLQQYQGDAINYPGFISTVDLNRVHTVRQGDTGDTEKWIQRRLPGVVVDGVFGPRTAAAVKMFQQAHGLIPDGVVGIDTISALAWTPPKA